MLRAKDSREFFSYKFPASGIFNYKNERELKFQELIDSATLILELAQFNSEQLEYCINRYILDFPFKVNLKFMETGYKYIYNKKEQGVSYYIDYVDFYNIKKMFAKQKRPFNLLFSISQGLVEDYFGYWCMDYDTVEADEVYNPDADWLILFNLP
mgnify:FL=1